MSQELSPAVIQRNGPGTTYVPRLNVFPMSTGNRSNTSTILQSTSSPYLQNPIPTTKYFSQKNTPFPSSRSFGSINPNDLMVPTITSSVDNKSINIPRVQSETYQTPTINKSQSYSTIPISGSAAVIQIPRLSPTIPIVKSSPMISGAQPPTRSSPTIPMIPIVKSSPMILGTQPSPIRARASPSARSAVLNLSSENRVQSVTIPIHKEGTVEIDGLTPYTVERYEENSSSPDVKITPLISNISMRPTVEITNREFEIKDYQGIIAKSSIENELLNNGYTPLSKIVVRAESGDKRTQYIKAINKKGQKVYILIDTNGYTTTQSCDITFVEVHGANIVPYSLKTGAYNCAGRDVCGVAFERGSDAICILSRSPQDLTPKETTFFFVEQHTPTDVGIESEENIMTYPVIRFSEIRTNPSLMLANTDLVTRRLRNSSYTAELKELSNMQQSIDKLNTAFVRFNQMCENAARNLNRTLSQLEQWNDIYMSNPPSTDETKDRYRKLQYNLIQRNEGILTLLRSMGKVTDKRAEIDAITREINDITDFDDKEFANVEYATSE
jgi:hypothetical protein